MGVFDDILTSRVDNEEDRKTLGEISAKYGLNAMIEDWDGKLKGWEQYSKDNIVRDPDDPSKVYTKAEVALRARNQELEGKVTALETAGVVNDMDFDQVIREIEKRGYAKPDDVSKAITPVRAALEEAQKASQTSTRNMEQFYWMTMNLPTKHAREFNEDLDAMKFRDFYVKGTEADPNRAYESFVADKRSAKQAEAAKQQEADRKAELDRVRAEGKKEGMTEAMMSTQGRGVPADQGGDAMGHFQAVQEKRLRGDQVPDDVDPAPGKELGKGLAFDGIKWLQQERAKGMVN